MRYLTISIQKKEKTMSERIWTDEQKAAIKNRDGTLIVSAAAGAHSIKNTSTCALLVPATVTATITFNAMVIIFTKSCCDNVSIASTSLITLD